MSERLRKKRNRFLEDLINKNRKGGDKFRIDDNAPPGGERRRIGTYSPDFGGLEATRNFSRTPEVQKRKETLQSILNFMHDYEGPARQEQVEDTILMQTFPSLLEDKYKKTIQETRGNLRLFDNLNMKSMDQKTKEEVAREARQLRSILRLLTGGEDV